MPQDLARPLYGADPGSFAYETMVRRLPEIGQRTLAEGSFSPQAAQRLSALFADLPAGRIRPLLDRHAPDWAGWQAQIERYQGQTWLEAPWFFCETYFYRRLVEACGYFDPDAGGADPFAAQKRLALAEARRALEAHAGWWEHEDDLPRLLYLALWGNQADLSMWPAGSSSQPPQANRQRLLVDDTPAALALLQAAAPPGRVDLVLDNTGAELAFDLLLADHLCRRSPVRLWVKLHPTFVSDAIAADIPAALQALEASPQPAVRRLALRLQDRLSEGRLQVIYHPFWTSGLPGWELPADLAAELGRAGLLISKGDANYRRWLGDRRWPFERPLGEILDYLPAPLLLLRVLKSEMVAGLPAGAAEAARQADPRWLIDGAWSLAQFA